MCATVTHLEAPVPKKFSDQPYTISTRMDCYQQSILLLHGSTAYQNLRSPYLEPPP